MRVRRFEGLLRRKGRLRRDRRVCEGLEGLRRRKGRLSGGGSEGLEDLLRRKGRVGGKVYKKGKRRKGK